MFDRLKGPLFMVLFCAGIPFGDSLIRLMRMDGIGVTQVLLLEHAAIALILLPFVWRDLRAKGLPESWGWLLIRALSFTGAALVWLGVIPFVPLSQLFAIGFLAPILAAVVSVFLLKERLTIHRIGSLIAGFAGAMVIVRPASGAVSPYLLIAMLSPLCWALMVVSTKKLADQISHWYLMVVSSGAIAVFTLPHAAFHWTPLLFNHYLFLTLVVCVGLVVHSAYILAYRHASLSRILPIEFSTLIFASLYGYMIFGELLDMWTMVGGAIIFTSSLYISLRRDDKSRHIPSPSDL